MSKCGFPVTTRNFPCKDRIYDSVLIRESKVQGKPVFWHVFYAVRITKKLQQVAQNVSKVYMKTTKPIRPVTFNTYNILRRVLRTRPNIHCVKCVQIRSYSWSVFSCIRTEYRDLLRKSPYLRIHSENSKIQIRSNSVFGHISRIDLNKRLFLSKQFSH